MTPLALPTALSRDQVVTARTTPLDGRVANVLNDFTEWLARYGETSRDHQTFFAGATGQAAKALYYRHKLLGTAAVAPMIFFEAFLPSARRLFHQPTRFPIADAHYAMGFAFLFQVTNDDAHLRRAIHFLEELKKSRSPGFAEYCWGYPYDWVTRNGMIRSQTPLITSTPYAYEAFLHVHELDGREEWKTAERNLNFVLGNQNSDGSWFYAVDGVRDFVDHYHTCFVMKALAKVYALTDHAATLEALRKGVSYYLNNLFDADSLPKPFSRAPRLTVYKRELYDCAECINLCMLLRDRFPALERTLETVVREILANWVKRDGSFRSRRLHLGWDNVPMHSWGQSQMFRSLAFYLRESIRARAQRDQRSDVSDQKAAPGNQIAEFIQK